MARSSADDRRLDVLRAIVTQYVSTREPVGSKAIAAGGLGVSPATIRNDMAILEEAGLIYQPHTSAGRVPTDRGYRVFVDRLAQLKPMSTPERNALEEFLSAPTSIDDVVEKAVRLLAHVTHQVALVQYPSTRLRVLKHLEILDLTPGRILLVLITIDGEVAEHTLTLHSPLSFDEIKEIRDHLRAHTDGATSQTISACLDEATSSIRPALADATRMCADMLAQMLRGENDAKIIVAGAANLARGAVDFHDIAPLLDALEEQVVLMRLFAQMREDEDLRVSIGAENQHDALVEAAVVAGTYRPGEAGTHTAHLGVVGPTRMDYAHTMSAVRAVAAYLSRFLAQ